VTGLNFMDGTQLCAQTDSELWFPEKGHPTEPAKAICHACPLEAACYDYALRFKLQGVWGGTSESQRKKAQAQMGLKAEPLRVEDERHGDSAGVRRHNRAGEPLCNTCREWNRSRRRTYHPIDGPDDPRHGSVNGYDAGCRNTCCSNAYAGYVRGVFTHSGERKVS
jgi:hypothetical protein